MLTVGEGHLELLEDPEAYIKNNPASRLPLVTSLLLNLCLKDDVEEIGEFIGELTQLIRLEFVWCKSLKSLPMSIANLSKLTFLSLSRCDSLVELPANIGQLVSLSHLQLYKCKNIKSLPDSMKDLCCLKDLFINECDSLTQLPIKLNVLHLHLIDSCPHFHPTGLINLKYLRVTLCNCSDESFANWKDPYSLQHLSISGCFRHNNCIIIKVPARLNQFVNLQVLSLHNPIRFVELPANLDGLAHLCLLDIRPSNIKCLPWSIMKLRKLQHLMLPEDFILETLPSELNNSVIISVRKRHVRKSWEELKTEIGELPIPCGGELGNDAAQNPSIISPPGYLRLEGDDDPSQWIINNRNLLMLVRFLDLEDVGQLTDSIMQFSELTHLYLYINGHICLPDNYFVTFTRLTHLSLHFSKVGIAESVIHSLSKLSNLQTLHLRLLDSELSENFNMPVSLKHLSLSDCKMRPLYDSLEKLTNLRSLDLNSCYDCESLPPCMYIHKLRLVDCSFKSLNSLPTGLHHLEILFSEDYWSCIIEDGWNKLVNLETLSITCFQMEFFPEDIARLHNLQKLQLKDCISLKKLPSNLHELVNLDTLDISITRIKILPPSFVKLRNLQHLILPKCFNFERLPRSLKQVSIIDDTEEAYYKSNAYDASLYQASAFDESEDEVTKLIVVPGESCNEDDYLVPTVEIHETVPDEQTSADPFNSISMGSIEHITTEQGGISQIYKDFCSSRSETPNPEAESIPAIQNDQNDITTMLIEQDNGENSHHDLENGQKQVPQHNEVERNKRTEISEEKLQQCWSENPMSLQETAEKIFGVSRSTMKRRLKELKLGWPSSKKGKQHLDDAKKRKHNSKAPFGSDSTQQNLVIPTNSTAQVKIVGGRIIGANQLTLPNHVSSNSDKTVESVGGNLMDTQGNMDSQHGEEHHLDGANDQGHLEGVLHSTESNRAATLEETSDPMVIESHMGIQQQVQGHLEGALHTTESSGTIVVKATYKELSVRIVFSLTLPINQLIEEIGMKFQLELNKYRLLYQDVDKEWMMLTSVEDLKYASNVAESLGTKFVRLSVIDYVV